MSLIIISLFVLLFFVLMFSSEVSAYFFMIQGLIFLSYISSPLISGLDMFDNVNFMMLSLSLFLGSVIIMLSSKEQVSLVTLLLLLILIYFSTESFMIFFMCYEFSLVPLMIILVSWGSQAERIKACQFMILYTIVFSSPLLLSISYGLEINKSMAILSLFPSNLKGVFFLFLLAFLVKAPIFVLHSWLPKAHVESPLIGSIILAGIMLKFGIYGLMRFLMIFKLSNFFKVWLFFFCLIGSILSCFLAISSDDMKMSVAYSSISHMNFLLSSIFSENLIILKGAVMTMVSHGITSPLLFILVTKIYSLSHTRSMIISKGFGSKMAFFPTISFLVWSLNFSVPPSLSFLGEITMISSILSKTLLSVIFIMIYIMTISLFSILNYGILSHSPQISLSKGNFSMNMENIIILVWGVSTVFLLFFFFDSLWI